jgi:hypothetical protein
MTTYLATHKRDADMWDEGEEITRPYCALCAVNAVKLYTWRRDDSYEFDEVCANCGKLVLASHN